MRVVPLSNRVIVTPVKAEEVSPGGIIIPPAAEGKPQRAVVIDVGAGKLEDGKLIPMSVEKGDHVVYGKYTGVEVTIDNKEYIIMSEDDILGFIPKEDIDQEKK